MDIKISIRNFMEKYQNVEYNLNYREGLLKEFLKLVNEIFEEDYKQIKEKGKEKAEEFKNLSYSIFYTNPLQTLKKGDIYYMALNPGGSEDFPYDFEKYDDWIESGMENYNAFENENWKGGDNKNIGQHFLQKRTIKILNIIIEKINRNLKISDILCTNLIFYRSSDYNSLLKKRSNFFEFHKLFLNIVKPKIIICNGNGVWNSAFTVIGNSNIFNLLNEQQSNFVVNQFNLSKKFNLKWFLTKKDEWNREKILVLGLPHLSRCDPNTYPEKYIKKIEEILNNNF